MGVRLNYNLDISDRSTWLTVTSRPQVRASFAYVQELGDFHCGPEYYTSRENLASYLIKYTVGGEGVLNYGGSAWRIQPGTAFWIDCMQPQDYRTAPGAGGWHMLWVHLYGPTVKAYYEAFREQNGDSPIIQAGPGAGFAHPLEALLDIYRTGGSSLQDDIQASMLLTQLMVSCIHRAGQLDSLYRGPRFIMDIRDFISVNYREDISLDSLAHNYSINKFYLQNCSSATPAYPPTNTLPSPGWPTPSTCCAPPMPPSTRWLRRWATRPPTSTPSFANTRASRPAPTGRSGMCPAKRRSRRNSPMHPRMNVARRAHINM